MNQRVLILLLIVIVLGGGAAVLLLSQQQGGTQTPVGATLPPAQAQIIPTEVPLAAVYVASVDIPRGAVIQDSDTNLSVRYYPVEAVPPGEAFDASDTERNERSQIVGKIARTTIPRGSFILRSQLVENLQQLAEQSKIGSDAAAVMPQGKVGVAIPIDRLTNVANAPKSGDYVDVILSFLFVDVDEEFQSRLPNRLTITTIRPDGTIEFSQGIEGRVEPSGDFPSPVVVGPQELQRPRLVTQRTIQTAFVIHVGTFPPDGDFLGRKPTPTPIPPPPDGQPTPTPVPQPPTATPLPLDMITLAVDPQDAVVLIWAIEARLPLTLALRAVGDLEQTSTDAVTLEYMISRFNVAQPPKLPYALEPAIRSIRRLVISNEVSLASAGQ